jgi:prophage antirepressor-like protein
MNIIPFNFDTHALRTIMRDGEPWFHAADVCNAIGYRNTSQAVAGAVDPEDQAYLKIGLPGSAPIFVNEIGLYALVLGSHLPAAKRFKRWVLGEVLPSIRRSGGYGLVAAHDPGVLAIIRTAYEEADRVVEHRTRHDFYSSSPRAKEHRDAVVAQEAAKRNLDASAVLTANQQSVTHVMATKYGDPDARRLLERQRVLIEAEVTKRIRLRAPSRKRR